jgi:sugar phosphate isomerase/epimerase
MEFGYCANLNFLLNGDEASRKVFYSVLDAGYDYIETPLSAFLQISPKQRAELEADMKSAGVFCRANFLLFPHDLPLVGEKLNLADIKSHVEKVLPIAAEIGSGNVIFGNGGSRRVQEGMNRADVRSQLVDILKTAAPVAERYGVNIAVEPLCQKETNIINSYEEGAELAREVGSSRIGTVMDWYHVAADGQSPVIAERDLPYLFHLHIANPEGRIPPKPSDDPKLYAAFVEAIKATGYDGRLSVEAGIPEGADISSCVKDALVALRKMFL